MSYQTYEIEWQGIRICIRYAPVKWNVISHIEIESIEPARAPLPITPTGYLSNHIPIGSGLPHCGGPPFMLVRRFPRSSDHAATSTW